MDDQGNWKGLDFDLCRGLAASSFGQSEGNFEVFPINWARRWPAVQSSDVDVIIKLSGWSQSRDTELNLAFSRPYFVAAFHAMAHADPVAENLADLKGGSISANTALSETVAIPPRDGLHVRSWSASLRQINGTER